jgi:nucleotide-binding universal stress UspA family protein
MARSARKLPSPRAAIAEVAQRQFPAETSIRVIIVCDPLKATLVGQLIPQVTSWVEEGNREERDWASDIVCQQVEKLHKAGLSASYLVKEGDPRRVLLDEAEEWQATTILVGARGLTAVDRFLLGSVSASVAQRADCTVEIVRSPRSNNRQKSDS